jgi:hypothetical protein
MVQSAAGESKAGGDVFRIEIGQFGENTLARKARGKEIQHVGYADTHAPYARTASALGGVHGNAFINRGHVRTT